jgi:hypothetical protein
VVQDVEGHEHTEGFWRELFLLKPDLAELKQVLDDIDPEFLLHAPVCVLSTSLMLSSDMYVASISPAAAASDSRRERRQRTIRRQCPRCKSFTSSTIVDVPTHDLDSHSVFFCCLDQEIH